MIAWMITIDSPPGVARDEDDLLSFSDALDAVRGQADTTTSLDVPTGVLRAVFTLDAEDVRVAVDAAVSAFVAALERVHIPQANAIHVDAEPMDEREPVVA